MLPIHVTRRFDCDTDADRYFCPIEPMKGNLFVGSHEIFISPLFADVVFITCHLVTQILPLMSHIFLFIKCFSHRWSTSSNWSNILQSVLNQEIANCLNV